MLLLVYLAEYFTHVTGGGVVKKPDAVYDNVQSLESCAQACYSDVQSFVCNSFYYCSVNSARQCRLSNQNVPDNPDSSNDSGCESYSSKCLPYFFGYKTDF